jgi:MHS family proline/betaine transporter-like MFS transporter
MSTSRAATTPSSAGIAKRQPASLRRTTAGVTIGNFTEWYDFGVYSYIIPIVAHVFFPTSSLANIAAFVGLTISFLVRPFGGIFWGLLGDRFGRKGILAFTVLLMAGGTCALGLLPGYAAIGVAAPLLLFACRAVQGLSTGGEYVGAMIFMAEHAPDDRRGFICSFLPVGTLSGYIFGALLVILLQAVLTPDQMQSWGWRIPFLLAAPLGLAGLYLRLRLDETPIFENQPKRERVSQLSGLEQFRKTLTGHWRPILVCGGLVVAFNVTNYMLTGYLPTDLSTEVGVAEGPALTIVTVVMAILVVIVTFLGRLGDRIGRKPIMMAGSLMLVFLSVPIFLLKQQMDHLLVFLATLPKGQMQVSFMSTEPSSLPALFPTNIRYGATSIGFNVFVSLFGGTTPLIAAALVEAPGNLLMPAYILIFAGVVGVISVLAMPEPAGQPLP